MRRRAVRDLGTILGIVVILCGVVAFNYLMRQNTLKDKMIAWRQKIEDKRESKGLPLLPWSQLEKTKGNMKRGPKFTDQLRQYDGAHVDLVGFMVPSDEFRKMKEFILLPMPISCYFCQAPPMRDIILVRMKEGKTTDLFEEPILLNGILTLHEGPGTKFFYTVSEATLGPGEKDMKLTIKRMDQEHIAHYQAAKYAEEQAKEKLLGAQEPPKPGQPAPPPAPMTEIAKENLLAGEIFLQENLKQPGVKELEHSGGVQYKVLKEGTGRTPTIHSRVKTHYRGTLMDGTEFDSSYERGQPAVFAVNKVITGWTDALTHMKEGDKWLLFIPSERAYGEEGMGKTIPPNATLIFELELIEVLD